MEDLDGSLNYSPSSSEGGKGFAHAMVVAWGSCGSSSKGLPLLVQCGGGT